jgi:hypothetical protein
VVQNLQQQQQQQHSLLSQAGTEFTLN